MFAEANQDTIFADFVHYYNGLDPEWAKENLDIREFCWLVQGLHPLESATGIRITNGWSKTDENLATIADLLGNSSVRDWQRSTFNPERFTEHKRREEMAKRQPPDSAPPDLPPLFTIAHRPSDITPLTDAISSARDLPDEPEPSDDQAVVDVRGVRWLGPDSFL